MNLAIVVLLAIGSSEIRKASADVGMLTTAEYSQFYNSSISNTSTPGWLLFSSSGLPDHPTYKVNPNNITAQNYLYILPANQTSNATLNTCVNLGVIGFIKNGVPIYNALNAPMDGSLDAVKNEVFDNCSGHPDITGAYHYHQLPACVSRGTVDEFLGVSIDGYPIYGPNASDIVGRLLNSSDLDACHGRFRNGRYIYYITNDFPYTIGCFRGIQGYNNATPAGPGGVGAPPGGSSGVSGAGVPAAQVSCTAIAANSRLCDCTIGVVSASDVAHATTTSALAMTSSTSSSNATTRSSTTISSNATASAILKSAANQLQQSHFIFNFMMVASCLITLKPRITAL